MKNFVILPASEGPRREFKITWGLRAGYGSAGRICQHRGERAFLVGTHQTQIAGDIDR